MDDVNPFARLTKQVGDQGLGSKEITKADRNQPIPLSYQQERLWFLDRLQSTTGAAYHIEHAVRFKGPLRTDVLRTVLEEVVSRHESLRTSFTGTDDGSAFQVIGAAPEFLEEPEGVSGLGHEALKERVLALLSRPFDLSSGPLFRAHLLRVSHNEHVLVIGGHHAVLDGWSVGVLMHEVGQLYRQIVSGASPTLPPLRTHYADYAVWQRELLVGERLEAELGWWRKYLDGVPTAMALPFDRPRAPLVDHQGAAVTVKIDPETSRQLKTLARSTGATMFMLLQAAFTALLSRLGAGEDLVIGTAVAGRPRAELESVVGFFANTLALRHRIDPSQSFLDHIVGVRQTTLAVFEHQAVPFEAIVEAVRPLRSMSHQPLVQVMLVLQNTPDASRTMTLPEIAVEAFEFGQTPARFELQLDLTETESGLEGLLIYAKQLFERDTAERLVSMFQRLLEAAVVDPATPIAELPLLDRAERVRLVDQFNATWAAYPKEKTVLDLFRSQALTRPEAVAVIDGEQTLTFDELDAASNRLGRHLISLGIGPESVVGVCLERSSALIVSLLAIWKAGGAYLPLDPDYPAERLTFMLADAGVRVVVANSATRSDLPPESHVRILSLDDPALAERIDSLSGCTIPDSECVAPLTTASLAYVIYTSGSTGRPKGVAVAHGGLVNRLAWMQNGAPLGADDVILQKTPATFDVSVWEFFWWATTGSRVAMLAPHAHRDPQAVIEAIKHYDVTTIHFVPSLFEAFVAELERYPDGLNITSLRRVYTSGEALGSGVVARFHSLARAAELDIRLINLYGPTEATVDVTQHDTTGIEEFVPIGTPVWNTQLYVVDERLEPQPVGVAGELLIGGVQVARGYLDRAGLTSERFIADPFSSLPGARLYRTGDLARWRKDGVLDFLGRIDTQVKIRGMRVELEEIEEALSDLEGIAHAAVALRGDQQVNMQLVAYLVPEPPQVAQSEQVEVIALDGLVDLEATRTALRRRLPDHMVPAAFIGLSELPLTSSGKLDRKALPDTTAESVQVEYAPPQSPMEALVASAIGDLLGLERVGRNDDFFAIGGHSLLALRLVSRLQAGTGKTLQVRSIFDATIVSELAALLENNVNGSAWEPLRQAKRDEALPLTYQQERLWFLDQLDGPSATYNIGGALEIVGPLDETALADAMALVWERHEGLRACFENADNGVRQVFLQPDSFSLSVLSASTLGDDALKDRIVSELRQPFDLNRGPLFRAVLLRCGTERHVLVVVIHHSVADEWSNQLLLSEISSAYSALVKGRTVDLPDLDLHYADYAVWQRQHLRGERLESELNHWIDKLSGIPPLLELPTDRPRPPVASHRGHRLRFDLPVDLSDRIRRLAVASGVTPFMVLEAAFASLLHRYTGARDFCIGLPVAGRRHAELDRMVGFFVNTLVLRHSFDGQSTFETLLAQSRELILEALEYQDTPFEAVVQHVAPVRSLSHSPVFQVMANWLEHRGPEEYEQSLRFGDLQCRLLELDTSVALFDLSLDLWDSGSAISGSLEYASDLFDHVRMERLLRHFETLLSAVIREPEREIAAIALDDQDEKRSILSQFGVSERVNEHLGNLLDTIDKQVKEHAGDIAVTSGGTRLTYAELDQESNRLARYLICKGVGPEVIVGACLDRSPDLVVALLAIWKAGGAYLPVDSNGPSDRVDFMIKDSGAAMVITMDEMRERLSTSIPCLVLDGGTLKSELSAIPFGPLRPEERLALPAGDNLAYIIYTSGSTGKPKGVAVQHSALLNFLHAVRDDVSLPDGSVLLGVTSINFDVSLQDLCLPLIIGGNHVIAERHRLGEPDYIRSLFVSEEPDFVEATPSVWRLAMMDGWFPPAGTRVVAGAEVLTQTMVQALSRGGAKVWNSYGPSETAVTVLSHAVDPNEDVVPIGKPFANTRVYVVDERLEPQPLGIAGELLIGGPQVSRGYMGRPGLTAQRFVADPFTGEPGARLYRTGDLARWREDGVLEFLGRSDQQVKVRGMRVELGEIETALANSPLISVAAVLAREVEGQSVDLVAYLVPTEVPDTLLSDSLGKDPKDLTDRDRSGVHVVSLEGDLDPRMLRAALLRSLPDHMIPTGFVGLTRLPLTTSGKVDRNALPQTDISIANAPYVAPRSATEQLICEMMRDVIVHDRYDLERVGIEDQFFNIGGHSIFAAQLAGRLEKALDRPVPVRWIFEEPTAKGLAGLLTSGEAMSAQLPPVVAIDRSQPIPASLEQERMWLLNEIHGARPVYNEGLPLVLRGRIDTRALLAATQGILDRYEVLRTRLVWRNLQLLQEIDEPGSLLVAFEDWSGRQEQIENLEAEAAARASALIAAPYDLTSEYPCRALVIKLSEEVHAWSLATHHIVGDDWSVSHVMPADLLALYDANIEGRSADLSEIRLHYADYAVWQRSSEMAAIRSAELDYWREQLSDLPEALDLPSDRPRPARRDNMGARNEPAHLRPDYWRAIELFAVAHDATPFMVFATALTALLYRLTGSQDIIIGTPHVSKPDSDLWPEFGYFGNTLALRSSVDGLQTFQDLFAQVRRTAFDAYRHEIVAFEEVAEALGTKPGNVTPVFQVMFVMHAFHNEQAFARDDLELAMLGDLPPIAKYDLTFDVNPESSGVPISVEYATDIFDLGTVNRLVAQFIRLLEAAMDAPDTLIADLPLIDRAERRLVLSQFNDTATEYSRNGTIVDLFGEAAARSPAAVAIVDRERELSYGELDVASNRLARHLIGLGVGPETVVGVCLDRSTELIVTLLGIWKAGGAYLPLDPEDPEERLTFVLRDAGAEVVVMTSMRAIPVGDPASEAGQTTCIHVVLDNEDTEARVAAHPETVVTDADRLTPLMADSLAYVIYTSGSTGQPKGVMVGHNQLISYINWAQEAYQPQAGTTVPINTAITFDATATSLWLSLINGCTIDLLSTMDVVTALRTSMTSGIEYSLLKTTPTQLELLYSGGMGIDVGHSAPGLIVIGGEALDASILAPFQNAQKTPQIVNEYGPTEATVGCVIHRVQAGDAEAGAVPIGNPVPNTQIYVVDFRFEPQPIGVAGELLIGGDQVTRGYLGRPGLTAERFVADPFSDKPGARIYRTGDLARWRPDGTLEFLGRVDHQVKVRGMRVELGEIEAALSAVAGVGQSVVTASSDASGDTRLVAYVVPSDPTDEDRSGIDVVPLEGVLDPALLRGELSRSLPDHMVPTGFVGLTRLPLTASGKIDRKALPATNIRVATARYVAPRDANEQLICEIMREVIAHDRYELEHVGIDDQFFDIGGHSIFAAQLAGRLEKALNRPVPVRWIFEEPTARGLSRRLACASDTGEQLPPVVPLDRSKPIPASLEQERMWLLNAMHEGRPVYNEGLPLVFRGRLDTAAFVKAVQAILDRYEVLRTHLVWEDGQLLQEIDQAGSLQVLYEDWSARQESVSDLENEAMLRASALIAAPYDMASDYPCRALVIKLTDEIHVWCLATHHVVGDNWSVSHVMPADFIALYDAHVAGRTADLPEIRLHYADYAGWQRSSAMAEVRMSELTYWRAQLSDIPVAIDLPFDRPRPAIRDHIGARVEVAHLSSDNWRAIERYSVAHDATPFMVFVAALSALLYRLTGSRDIVVGTPHVSKPDADLWPEFGYFGNTLALRSSVDGLQTFDALFAQVRQTVFEAYRHQNVSFEEVTEALGTKPANVTPVFQVMLVMHAFLNEQAFARDDIELGVLGEISASAKYDLTFDVNPGSTGVRITIDYATDIFDAETIERLGAMFGRVLETVSVSPDGLIRDIPLLDDAERLLVVSEYNNTAHEYRRLGTVVDLFGEQAATRSKAVAVDDGKRAVAYDELDAASNRLAQHLLDLNVGPETVVAVCLERSAALIECVLAISKAGGAYMLLDPSYPDERLAIMLQDGQASLLLTRSVDARRFLRAARMDDDPNWRSIDTLQLDDPDTMSAINRCSTCSADLARRSHRHSDQDLAYVTFTSGSTGRPKAIAATHQGLKNFICWLSEQLEGQETFNSLLRTSPSFDAINREIWLPLVRGGSIRMPDFQDSGPFLEIDRHLGDLSVSFLSLVPTILKDMRERGALGRIPSGAFIYSSGEILPQDLTGEVLSDQRNIRIFNGYGPSETTMNATGRFCSPDDDFPVPNVGKPIHNMQVYILNQELEPQPIGVVGELMIGGSQISRGYLGRPGMTAEVFLPDPFRGVPGARMYRTGDLARWRRDGTLEFFGRIDSQIKIRGMRVELGEIEAALAAFDEIEQATVVAKSNADGDASLVAYIVPNRLSMVMTSAGGGLEEAKQPGEDDQLIALDDVIALETLRGGLRRVLPEHMIPRSYAAVSHLPLTPSGKVDRRALPEVEFAHERPVYRAPATHLEEEVAGAFAEVLGVDGVGIDDNFFDMGGHSMLVVRLVAALRQKTGQTVEFRQVFEAATVRGLASLLEKPDARPTYMPVLQFDDGSQTKAKVTPSRPILICVHPISGHATIYNRLVEPLGDLFKIAGVQSRGTRPGEAPFDSYTEAIEIYQAALMEALPEGPTFLLGWSAGGYIAHDLACRLLAAGRDVRGLILLDTINDRLRGQLTEPQTFEIWLSHLAEEMADASRSPLPKRQDLPGLIRGIARMATEQDMAGFEGEYDPILAEHVLRHWHRMAGIMAGRPQTACFPRSTLVIGASDTRREISDPALGWSEDCGPISTTAVEFDHHSMLSWQAVDCIAPKIRSWMATV